MRKQIRIIGLGGQGIVLLGQIIGQAGIYDKRYVAQSSTYGPETRGSLCRSEVILSDSPIDYPYALKSDILLAMTQKGYEAFIGSVTEPNGIVFYDAKLVEASPKINARHLPVPATELATKTFESPTPANIIMLGAVVATADIISRRSTLMAIKETVNPNTLSANIEAFNQGIDLWQKLAY